MVYPQVSPCERDDLPVLGFVKQFAEEKRPNESSRSEDRCCLHDKTIQFFEFDSRAMKGVSSRQYRLAIRHLYSVYLLGGNYEAREKD
jgi:hypothetical protein